MMATIDHILTFITLYLCVEVINLEWRHLHLKIPRHVLLEIKL